MALGLTDEETREIEYRLEYRMAYGVLYPRFDAVVVKADKVRKTARQSTISETVEQAFNRLNRIKGTRRTAL